MECHRLRTKAHCLNCHTRLGVGQSLMPLVSDVQGLGFVQGTLTAIGTGGDGNKPTQGYIGSGQWAENAQFLFHNPDGKNHSVMGFDGVDMFLTW